MITKETTYTEKFVEKELSDMMKEIEFDEDIIYIGQLFLKRPYSHYRFSEWAKKFRHHDKISQSIKNIKATIETRVNIGGLKNDLNANMVKFNLTNNYGDHWKEKKEETVKHVTDEVDLTKFTDQQLDQYLALKEIACAKRADD